MKKLELARKIQESLSTEKMPTQAVIMSIIDAYREILLSEVYNGSARIPQIGSFSLKTRKGRQYYDMYRQQTFDAPEKTVIKFKASKALSEAINEL